MGSLPRELYEAADLDGASWSRSGALRCAPTATTLYLLVIYTIPRSNPKERSEPDRSQGRVREPVRVGVEDPAPHHRDEDGRVHEGQVEERAVEDVRPGSERLV